MFQYIVMKQINYNTIKTCVQKIIFIQYHTIDFTNL